MPPRKLAVPGQPPPSPPPTAEETVMTSRPATPAETSAAADGDVVMAEGSANGSSAGGANASRLDNLPAPMEEEDNADEDGDEEDADDAPSSDPNLLASLPVYLSTSLPSTSSLHVFQYPNYPHRRPLPVPDAALTAGQRPAMRWRPKANRVEVEIPLDDRPALYNRELGHQYGIGAEAGGSIGDGRKKIKKEESAASTSRRTEKVTLRKTRLESAEVPHATTYMVGVIRDGALHLTPLESIIQLRPSMHYLDEIRRLEKESNRRDARAAGAELSDASGAELSGNEAGPSSRKSGAAAGADRKKATTIQVTVKQGDQKRGTTTPGAGDRDGLMAAQYAAEAEEWIDCEWFDENSHESQKAFDAQLFSSTKTVLKSTTRPRDFLPRMT